MNYSCTDEINYRQLLDSALDPKQEKRLNQAFIAFNSYSVLNQILAASQLDEIAPIASENTWFMKGRSIKNGSEPIELIVPVTTPIINQQNHRPLLDYKGKPLTRLVGFRYESKWFSLKQTEGEPLDWKSEQINAGEWNAKLALKVLDISITDFDMVDGNIQGYATKRRGKKEIAINPLSQFPQSVLFHELAHHALGHFDGYSGDAIIKGRYEHCMREVEAECVTFICCASLGLKGLVESRDYIHSYLEQNKVSEKRIQRIFTSTNKILKAGF